MPEENENNRIHIDWKKVDELMMAGCLGTEIAAYFGVHPNTFYRRVEEYHKISFSDYFAKMKGKGCSLLRAQQYMKALGITDKGDNTLLIWLGKNRLGQRDKEDEGDKEPINQAVIDKDKEIMELQYKVAQLEGKNASKPEAS